jgi:hypothetical protein
VATLSGNQFTILDKNGWPVLAPNGNNGRPTIPLGSGPTPTVWYYVCQYTSSNGDYCSPGVVPTA